MNPWILGGGALVLLAASRGANAAGAPPGATGTGFSNAGNVGKPPVGPDGKYIINSPEDLKRIIAYETSIGASPFGNIGVDFKTVDESAAYYAAHPLPSQVDKKPGGLLGLFAWAGKTVVKAQQSLMDLQRSYLKPIANVTGDPRAQSLVSASERGSAVLTKVQTRLG